MSGDYWWGYLCAVSAGVFIAAAITLDGQWIAMGAAAFVYMAVQGAIVSAIREARR